MRELSELLAAPNPAWPLIQTWVAEASNPVEVLPPNLQSRAESLRAIQVTVGSVLGAIAYETGGLLVDHGWVRHLGSGHPRLTRSVASWNAGRTIRAPDQSPPFFLVADDVLGGFFAINGGAFATEPGDVCYLGPDTLEWQSLGVPHSHFVSWLLEGDLAEFYQGNRWDGWQAEVGALSGDMAYSFYPFLSAEAKSIDDRSRMPVPIEELYRLHVDGNA
jgi:hypothetical protein